MGRRRPRVAVPRSIPSQRGVDVSWTGRREMGVSRASTNATDATTFCYRLATAA